MNTHDPIFESLDRLAGVADTEPVGDRMPDIKRRVRVARRRKGAGLAVAAALIAVAGVGVSQGLPTTRTAPPPANPGDTTWQEITIAAEEKPAGALEISYSVSGRSSRYTDSTTGEPSEYAGPLSTKVLVDGRVVSSSEQQGLSCEQGGGSARYSKEFHLSEPLRVPVPTEGDHTIVVIAPYCADGEMVDSTQTLVVQSSGGGFTTFDRKQADLDADGAVDVIKIRVPVDTSAESQLLQVDWGNGDVATTTLPNLMETSLLDPIDLDGDGDLELITQGGGGETSVTKVFQADRSSLDEVETVDAADTGASLATSAEPTTWQVHVTADGIYSYRLTDPTTLDFPAPVVLRQWILDGNTLTLPEQSETQCVSFQPVFELGPC